jgi:hypothetical protein
VALLSSCVWAAMTNYSIRIRGQYAGVDSSPAEVNLQHAEGKKYLRYFGDFEMYARQRMAEYSKFDTPKYRLYCNVCQNQTRDDLHR